jgi:hypothetical protein
MSHRDHIHNQPLPPAPGFAGDRLPDEEFIGLVGTYQKWTLDSENDPNHENPDHVYVWIAVSSADLQGAYECAFNALSNQAPNPQLAIVQYYERDQTLAPDEWPAQGLATHPVVNYGQLGLTDDDFHTILEGNVRQLVESYATNCQLICAYGTSYSDGTGLDKIHRNQPNQDGAIIFYFDANHGGPVARWLFIKFQDQTIS